MIPSYIKFIFSNEGVNIPNLIVYFILNVKNKNDYTIGPLITNERGEITLTKGQLESIINQYNMDSPMDYAGSLDSCIGIDILVESYEELRNRLLALQEFYPQNALSLKNAIKVCMNKNYRIYRKFKFPIIDRNVFVNVEDD